jgi:hypothetical protein
MSKEKPKTPPENVEMIEYEKFCDYLATNYKKGMFVLSFGQVFYEPPRVSVRIWVDARTLKTFLTVLQNSMKEYEQKHGKIE